MDVNVKRAVKMFFSKSSFEMIYFEAFANAVDAGATEFNIHVKLPKTSDWVNMTLDITDNGVGFTEERFKKFKKLLDVEERTHKGLGRLVYLCYFDKVRVESVFEPGKLREFEFSDEFEGNNEIVETNQEQTGSSLCFIGFNNEKIGKSEYLNPSYIKRVLLQKFYMKFYKAKQAGRPISVSITLTVGGESASETITADTIPNFLCKELTEKVDLFYSITLYYYFNELGNKRATSLASTTSSRLAVIASPPAPPLKGRGAIKVCNTSFMPAVPASMAATRRCRSAPTTVWTTP